VGTMNNSCTSSFSSLPAYNVSYIQVSPSSSSNIHHIYHAPIIIVGGGAKLASLSLSKNIHQNYSQLFRQSKPLP
jgi:hypothetical protein